MPIKNVRYLVVVAILGSNLVAQTALAGSNCAPHATVRTVLSERFGETRRKIGINKDMQIAEIYASTRTGSWTLVITVPKGPSCVVTSGQNYSDGHAVTQLLASVR